MTTSQTTRPNARTDVWLWERSRDMAKGDGLAVRRELLARRFGGDAHDWAFAWDTAGQPNVTRSPHHRPVFISAARTETVEVFAAGDRGPLGVDIETFTHGADRLAYVARCFSPRDQRLLARQSDVGRATVELWTRTEALGKALGVGLALAADHRLRDSTSWHVEVCSPRADLCLATATRCLATQTSVQIEWIEPSCPIPANGVMHE